MGQTVLFNLFCTIVRYADGSNLNMGHHLEQIEGIVIIDEIDAHLHADLQFEVLPTLIKLFPKVQFIVSTHSPILLMGMEKEYGDDEFAIIEMPSGEQISTERFSEFERSLECYKQTVAFEREMKDRILAQEKPMVLLEGDTDRDYLRCALSVFEREDLLGQLVIDWVGSSSAQGAQHGGKDALNGTIRVFSKNPNLLQQRLLLLYDCDAKKPSADYFGKLFVRCIPQSETNEKITRGIENLLPPDVFEDHFYEDISTPDGGLVKKLKKRELCNDICAQHTLAHFEGFRVVIPFLDELANKTDSKSVKVEQIEEQAAVIK
ncbi:MAG: AAA family ATPase [Planctomycetes bacterium]|nr:AAA family ATPase [Planctomycetota bacterium]